MSIELQVSITFKFMAVQSSTRYTSLPQSQFKFPSEKNSIFFKIFTFFFHFQSQSFQLSQSTINWESKNSTPPFPYPKSNHFPTTLLHSQIMPPLHGLASSSNRRSGEVHVIIGPMFAGKSTALLRRITAESDSGRPVPTSSWSIFLIFFIYDVLISLLVGRYLQECGDGQVE